MQQIPVYNKVTKKLKQEEGMGVIIRYGQLYAFVMKNSAGDYRPPYADEDLIREYGEAEVYRHMFMEIHRLIGYCHLQRSAYVIGNAGVFHVFDIVGQHRIPLFNEKLGYGLRSVHDDHRLMFFTAF